MNTRILLLACISSFDAKKIPCDAEVQKKEEELDIPLPADNLDFYLLALTASQGLPREVPGATREKLGGLVKYQRLDAKRHTALAGLSHAKVRDPTKAVPRRRLATALQDASRRRA